MPKVIQITSGNDDLGAKQAGLESAHLTRLPGQMFCDEDECAGSTPVEGLREAEWVGGRLTSAHGTTAASTLGCWSCIGVMTLPAQPGPDPFLPSFTNKPDDFPTLTQHLPPRDSNQDTYAEWRVSGQSAHCHGTGGCPNGLGPCSVRTSMVTAVTSLHIVPGGGISPLQDFCSQ